MVHGSAPAISNASFNVGFLRHNILGNSEWLCGLNFGTTIGTNCKYTAPAVAPAGTWTVTASTFTAGARGWVQGAKNASQEDQWTINHRKELINTINGAL